MSPQPLPIFSSCSVNLQNMSSWSQNPPAVLFPLCYCSFPSIATHPYATSCYMASQVLYKTIKMYLADIWLEHLERGLEDPTKDELLHVLCTGIKRSQGIQTHTYLPITINFLQTLKLQLHCDPPFSPFEKKMLWAPFTLALKSWLLKS